MRLFFHVGLLAASVFAFFVVYAVIIELARPAVSRTTYVKMGPVK